MAFLGSDETSSVIFETASLEQIPAGYYTETELLNDPLDTAEDNSFGANSPAGIDSEFGYDFYMVDAWPSKYSGDKAVTTSKNGSTASIGGFGKVVNLGTYSAGDKLSAYIYAASTFTDSASDASFALEFYNAANVQLGTATSALLSGTNYRWLLLDRVAIPTGTTYVKFVPAAKLGASETSGVLFDTMKLNLLHH